MLFSVNLHCVVYPCQWLVKIITSLWLCRTQEDKADPLSVDSGQSGRQSHVTDAHVTIADCMCGVECSLGAKWLNAQTLSKHTCQLTYSSLLVCTVHCSQPTGTMPNMMTDQ